jgi:hypothetical protein
MVLGTAAGLLLAPLAGLALAAGSELSGVAATGPAKSAPPAKPAKEKKKADTCGSFGTSVEFVDTPSEAARMAKKEQKLVFVLHVSGNFEDPRFT